MKKSIRVFAFTIMAFGLSSCADDLVYTNKDGKQVVAEPYGWANAERCHDRNVYYEPSIGNVVWSVILVETLVMPIYFTGWSIMIPVEPKEQVNEQRH